MMDIAWLPGFDDQSHFRARALTDEMVVYGRDAEQARNRRPFFIDASVAEDQELIAVLDGLGGLPAEFIDGRLQPVRSFGHAEQHPQGLALEMRIGDHADFFEIRIGQDRLLHLDPAAGFRRSLP